MGLEPHLSWKSSIRNRTRRDGERWDHLATTQDKSNHLKNQTHKSGDWEALWYDCRIANIVKTGRADAVQKKSEYSLVSQLIRASSHAGRNFMPISENWTKTTSTPRETSEETEDNNRRYSDDHRQRWRSPSSTSWIWSQCRRHEWCSPHQTNFAFFQLRNACAMPETPLARPSVDHPPFNTHAVHNTTTFFFLAATFSCQSVFLWIFGALWLERSFVTFFSEKRVSHHPTTPWHISRWDIVHCTTV